MDDVTRPPPARGHAPALKRFETETCAGFETWISPRPAGNRSLDSLEAVTREQVDDRDAMFGIFRRAHNAGRLNCIDFAHSTATPGYRIGRVHGGRRIASRAVILGLATAQALHLDAVEAQAKLDNRASVRVLETAGFRTTNINDTFRYFRQTLDTDPPGPQISGQRRRA